MSAHEASRFTVGHATVRILHDDAAGEAPYAGDDGVRIVMLHRRYSDPAEGACGDTPEDVAAWCEANAAEWFTIPLFMYEHSGRVWRVGESNPFGDRWDSGRVGIVALRRVDWRRPKIAGDHESDYRDATEDELAESAASVIATWGDWAEGNVWGYVVDLPDEEHVDSCWGFIGDSDDAYLIETATDAARYFSDQYEAEKARELEATRPDMYGADAAGAEVAP